MAGLAAGLVATDEGAVLIARAHFACSWFGCCYLSRSTTTAPPTPPAPPNVAVDAYNNGDPHKLSQRTWVECVDDISAPKPTIRLQMPSKRQKMGLSRPEARLPDGPREPWGAESALWYD